MRPMSTSRSVSFLSFALATLSLLGCSSESTEVPPIELNLIERLYTLGAAPCEDAPGFLCLSLPVPWDHAAPSGPTFPLAVAVRPARGLSRGSLLVVDGGPGYSGVADADDLTWLDPRLSEQLDLVYFDLRGLAGSGGLDCPIAASAWYTGGLRGQTAEERAEVAARAAQFVTACPAEAGWSADELSFLTTAQAVEDLEALRLALGISAWTLYGLSYGTQLSQEYARAHPETTRAVALDGVVDLTLTDLDYATSLNRAVNTVLDSALAACDEDADCAAEVGDAAALYDDLAASLDAAPATFDAPQPSGELRPRTFSRADLDALTLSAMDNAEARSWFLRTLAAASQRGDFVPMRRLLDAVGGYDPETDQYVTGDFSDAIYYAVTCNDYGRLSGGEAAYLARGEELAAEGPRATSPLYGDLPCATWTSAPAEQPRPAAFAPPGVPTLLINAEGDVATPVAQGEAVFSALQAAGAPGRVIRVAGGRHVMWGWGNACVDAPVTAFLLDPSDPSLASESACDDGMLAGYVPLSPATAAEVDDALALFAALATELWAVPYFPSAETFGCDRGGFVAVDDELAMTLSACAFFPDLTVDGTGSYDEATGKLSLTLSFTGAHEGEVTYFEDETGLHVDGTFDGATVSETE